MYLRLDSFEFLFDHKSWYVLFVVIPLSIATFVHLGLYRAIIRYISSKALRVIIVGCLVSSVTMFITDQAFVLPVPRSVPFIYSVLMFCTIGGIRFALRTLYRLHISPPKDNVMIYGAGHSGRQLLNALDQEEKYNVVSFIDDNAEIQGREIGGVRVNSPTKLEELITEYNISAILLAVPSATANQRRRIINRIELFPVEVRTMPTIGDLIAGRSKINELRIIEIDELLGRNPVQPHQCLMSKNVSNKVVLVSGAGGSIGSELCRQITSQKPKTLIMLDTSEFSLYRLNEELEKNIQRNRSETKLIPILGSVLDKVRVATILGNYNVNSIYHAAAYKHVPLIEQNTIIGLHNNIFGTKALAEAAIETQVKSFTLISTDKAVRPTNVMGASKRVAELICQALAQEQSHTKFSIVRFGNVLGSSGSVIPKFRDQISVGGPVTVTDSEITRYFMTIPEAAQLVIQASAMAVKGDVFVLDMGKSIKIIDLAERMIRLNGLAPYRRSENESDEDGDIEIKITGLRPGEKLHEELFIAGEPSKTIHPRIFMISEYSLSWTELGILLNKLPSLFDRNDVASIRRLLADAPIGYVPNSDIVDLVSNGNKA